LARGTRVIPNGVRLHQRRYGTSDGQSRTVIELQVEEIGPSIGYATAQATQAPGPASSAEECPDDEPAEQQPAPAG